jgi:hypothetical protein
MTEFERKYLDNALMDFTKRNFVKPEECKNPDQARYYTNELNIKMEEYRTRFKYVPEWAKILRTQYLLMQNSLINKNFRMLI